MTVLQRFDPSERGFSFKDQNAFGWELHFAFSVGYFAFAEVLRALAALIFRREGARA